MNPNTVDLAPLLNSLIAVLAPVAAALVAHAVVAIMAWLRSRTHWKILEDARMNDELTAAAQRFAAAVLSDVQKRGDSIHEVNVGNPLVASFARRIIHSYPEFTRRLGMTPQTAAAYILDEAKRLGHLSPTVPAPMPSAQGAATVPLAPPNIQLHP